MDNSAVSAMDLYRHTRGMSLVDRFTVLTNTGDECIREVELWFLLKRKTTPVCYVWFEPSPKMSIDEGPSSLERDAWEGESPVRPGPCRTTRRRQRVGLFGNAAQIGR